MHAECVISGYIWNKSSPSIHSAKALNYRITHSVQSFPELGFAAAPSSPGTAHDLRRRHKTSVAFNLTSQGNFLFDHVCSYV